MSKNFVSGWVGFVALGSFVALVGCSVEAEEETDPSTTSDAITTVGAVECNPRSERPCDRGESCLGVNVGRATKYVCATNRCQDQRDCRQGYTCRVNACIALERQEQDEREVRRIRLLRDIDSDRRVEALDRDRTDNERRPDGR